MTRVRVLVGASVAALIAVGYLASQVAFFQGSSAEYAARVDSPPIVMLAMVVLLAVIALFFIPDREEPKP